MANIAEITIKNTVKESRQMINKNFANLNEGLSTAGSVKTVNNILPDNNGNITVDLGSYATIIAKMQSFFNGTMEETTLFDATGSSSLWTGNITLSQPYTDFDFITIEFSSGYAATDESHGGFFLYPTKLLNEKMAYYKAQGVTTCALCPTDIGGSWYWNTNPQTATTTYFPKQSNDGCYPKRVMG